MSCSNIIIFKCCSIICLLRKYLVHQEFKEIFLFDDAVTIGGKLLFSFLPLYLNKQVFLPSTSHFNSVFKMTLILSNIHFTYFLFSLHYIKLLISKNRSSLCGLFFTMRVLKIVIINGRTSLNYISPLQQ